MALIMLVLMAMGDLAIPRLIEHIIDQGVKQNRMDVVLNTSVIMIGISLFSTAVTILNNIFSIRTGESVARDMREAIFLKIQHFSYGDLDRFSTGKLMVRLTSDVNAVQRLVQISLRIGTRAPLLMVGSIILMFMTSARLATAMIPVLLVTLVVIMLFSAKMEPLFRIVQIKLDYLNTVLQENIAGAHLIKAFVRADYETQRFDCANDDLTDNTIRVMQFMATMSPILTIFVNIGIVLVIWYGGLQTISNGLQVGQIIAFTNYLLTTMTPIILMAQLSNVWANGSASIRRINEVLDTEPEVQFKENAFALTEEMDDSVDFRKVNFHYRGNSTVEVLDGIELRNEPGKIVAVLGATGAGKSSLVNLIPRFYDVTGGQLLVGGMDVRALQEGSLLSRIGIVPQESILFSGTVRENICYGKPDASEEEIIQAAQIAQAHDFIMQMPAGYDTYIEERGVNLSGGQKQRLSIARAVISQPRILILDDSTSSVDVETETHIQEGLRTALHNCSVFIVAQRISTVLNADKIIVLDKGRIIAQGQHDQLIKTSAVYREIYDSQLGNGFNGHSGKDPE